MARKYTFLAFDCGATSGRAVLATFSWGEAKEYGPGSYSCKL